MLTAFQGQIQGDKISIYDDLRPFDGRMVTIIINDPEQVPKLGDHDSSDPFYSAQNLARLQKSIEDVNAGRATLKEHALIGADE